VCFVVHNTTSELERMILTTLYLVGAKNTDKDLKVIMFSKSKDLIIIIKKINRGLNVKSQGLKYNFGKVQGYFL
jgi:hypothetical protein